MLYYHVIYTTLLSWLLLTKSWVTAAARSDHHQKNNECVDRVCGNLTIKFPFGIGKSCYKNEYFHVTCNTSSSSSTPKPILTKFNLELLDINNTVVDGAWASITVQSPVPSPTCISNMTAKLTSQNAYDFQLKSIDLRGSPFFFDSQVHSFVSVGCDGYASLYNETGGTITGCASTCSPTARVIDGCNGYHCCEVPLNFLNYENRYIQRYSIGITMGDMIDNETRCRSAFLIQRSALQSKYKNYATAVDDDVVPFILSWNLPSELKGDVFHQLEIIAELFSIGLGISLFSFGFFYSYWLLQSKRRRKEARLRTKYFKKRLEQTSSNKEVVEKAKLFSMKEIKKSTDNFNEDRILGSGGQGTVYKGMLDNGKIIAVKKSKTFEESQWEEFINELILLSQVNHRNIVKILGCCLETKVPILVYEFISNGTLFEHIHNSSSAPLITWEMRLRIAIEASGAIAYLHSSSTTPIYHRDIKSTNILLDEMYRAKVSDFGISKAISIDQTHLTTHVRGTFGYVDPEYFKSSQYSEKSDVYSFGVILIELLTGQQAIRTVTIEEERSLVDYFILSMNQNALEEILDPVVLAESRKEEVMAVANLTTWCLHSRGALRPTMKEVALELEMIRNNSNSMAKMSSEMQLTDSTLAGPTFEIGNVYNNLATCGVTIDLGETCCEEKCLIYTS